MGRTMLKSPKRRSNRESPTIYQRENHWPLSFWALNLWLQGWKTIEKEFLGTISLFGPHCRRRVSTLIVKVRSHVCTVLISFRIEPRATLDSGSYGSTIVTQRIDDIAFTRNRRVQWSGTWLLSECDWIGSIIACATWDCNGKSIGTRSCDCIETVRSASFGPDSPTETQLMSRLILRPNTTRKLKVVNRASEKEEESS